MPETYLNLAAILSLLNIHDIKCKIATDFKLLNILLGISVCSNHELASNEASSHVNHDSYRNLQLKFVIAIFKGYGAKFACAFCEGVSTLTSGNLRTFGLLKQRYRDFVAAGSKLKDAQFFFNVIHPCLLPYEDHQTVISQIPPPPLHMLIGATNSIMNFIINIKGDR